MTATQPVIEILSHLDRQDESEKDIPVAHYLIDLRSLMLIQKVSRVLGKNQNRYNRSDLNFRHQDGFSEHQLGYLLLFLNKKFGNDIA